MCCLFSSILKRVVKGVQGKSVSKWVVRQKVLFSSWYHENLSFPVTLSSIVEVDDQNEKDLVKNASEKEKKDHNNAANDARDQNWLIVVQTEKMNEQADKSAADVDKDINLFKLDSKPDNQDQKCKETKENKVESSTGQEGDNLLKVNHNKNFLRTDSVTISESEKSLDSGMFTGSDVEGDNNTANSGTATADLLGGKAKQLKRTPSGRWLRVLSKYFDSLLDNGGSKTAETSCSNVKENKSDTQPVKPKQKADQKQEKVKCQPVKASPPSEIIKDKSIQRQIKRHTFGRVKRYVVNRSIESILQSYQHPKPTRKDLVIREIRTRSTPPTPRTYLSRSPSPAVTPRMSESLNYLPVNSAPVSPRFRSLSGHSSLVSQDGKSSTENLSSKASCVDVEAKWRVRVWLRLLNFEENMNSDLPAERGRELTVQLCHVCRPTCNYQTDLKYVRGSKGGSMNDILWYRYLGR